MQPDEYYDKGYGKGYEKYTQTQRLEQCMYPSAPCSYIDPYKLESSWYRTIIITHLYGKASVVTLSHFIMYSLQKHNFVRLLAYTYEEGLHIDSFKLPIACSCHVEKPGGYGYAPRGYGYGHPKTPAVYPPHPAPYHGRRA